MDRGRIDPEAGALEQALDRVIDSAVIDPAQVVSTARRLGLPMHGEHVLEQLASLRGLHADQLDQLAQTIVRSYSRIAGVQGFVTNLGGLVTLPVALPADAVATVTWVVRATSGVMASFGFDPTSEEGRADLRIGLLVAFGVNKITVAGSSVLVTQLTRRVMTAPYRDQLAGAVVRRIAQRLGMRLTRRNAARVVPIIGGVIGGGVNVAMVRAMGARTRRHYRGLLEEWQQMGRVTVVDIARADAPALPPPPPAPR
jgi:hypothetical protein